MKSKCDLCPKSFNNTGNRDRHRATVHADRPPFYKCDHGDCTKAFPYAKQLEKHVIAVHYNNYKCSDCGNRDFRTKQMWTRHRLATHASYEEKVQHAATGENFLTKIYLFIHESNAYCKIGYTTTPISRRLSELATKHNEDLYCSKFWVLSEKFHQPETEIFVEFMENELHEHMRELGFEQRKREYFIFRNRELEEKLIQYLIETIIEKHEQTELPILVPSTEVARTVRKETHKFEIVQPLEKRLKMRQRKKRQRERQRMNYIYCASNGVNVVKIGETIKNPKRRIAVHNCEASHYDKFTVFHQFALGNRYAAQTTRMNVELRIIIVLRQHFPLVAGSHEHFAVTPSQHAKVIEIIQEIINNL